MQGSIYDNSEYKYYGIKGWALVGKVTTKAAATIGDYMQTCLQWYSTKQLLYCAKLEIVSQVVSGSASLNFSVKTLTGASTQPISLVSTDPVIFANQVETVCPTDIFGTGQCNGLRQVYGH